jgi:hypothetical protein
MSDSSAPTRPQPPPGSADPQANTVGWVAAPAAAPALASDHVHTLPAASTPGPFAPELRTDSNTTEQLAAQRRAEAAAGLPRLPPVPGYDVRRFVGRGGMGLVYEAVQLSTGRTVALKLVNPSGVEDPVGRSRFDREVRTLAALKHPNIVPVYDAGEWHGFPYCAMEFAHGGTLSAHVDRIRADVRGAVRLAVKVARAVAAMHAADVLHRDIKPLNVLLGADDEPMVADFGLARFVGDGSDLTYSGQPVGTRLYMALEQTHGRRADYTPACDIWALGVTLYELFTGRRPFEDDGETDIYHRVRFDDPPPFAQVAPDVPAELEAVVRHCLAKRPEDRYARAADVADDLERWLAGQTVAAPPVPVAPARPPVQLVVAPPKSRRRAALVGAAAVVAVGLVAAGFFGAFRAKPAPPPSRAEQVRAGKTVALTDDKGKPTGEWVAAGGRTVTGVTKDGYFWFVGGAEGIVALADDDWGCDTRVEADVAVRYTTEPDHRHGGVYVGRREWAGADKRHDSLVWFGVGPRFDKTLEEAKQYQIGLIAGAHWWEHNQLGSPLRTRELRQPWNVGGAKDGPRFVRVVIDQTGTTATGTVDGQALPAHTEKDLLSYFQRSAIQFPDFTFAPPALGPGIGVYCHRCELIVANLTVSKLPPPPKP